MEPSIFGPSPHPRSFFPFDTESFHKVLKELGMVEDEKKKVVDRARNNLAVAEAWARGEEIQSRYITNKDGEWFACPEPRFSPDVEYRIKPKAPREWWINLYSNGGHIVHDSKGDADLGGQYRTERVHVREVLEETK